MSSSNIQKWLSLFQFLLLNYSKEHIHHHKRMLHYQNKTQQQQQEIHLSVDDMRLRNEILNSNQFKNQLSSIQNQKSQTLNKTNSSIVTDINNSFQQSQNQDTEQNSKNISQIFQQSIQPNLLNQVDLINNNKCYQQILQLKQKSKQSLYSQQKQFILTEIEQNHFNLSLQIQKKQNDFHYNHQILMSNCQFAYALRKTRQDLDQLYIDTKGSPKQFQMSRVIRENLIEMTEWKYCRGCKVRSRALNLSFFRNRSFCYHITSQNYNRNKRNQEVFFRHLSQLYQDSLHPCFKLNLHEDQRLQISKILSKTAPKLEGITMKSTIQLSKKIGLFLKRSLKCVLLTILCKKDVDAIRQNVDSQAFQSHQVNYQAELSIQNLLNPEEVQYSFRELNQQ